MILKAVLLLCGALGWCEFISEGKSTNFFGW